MPGQSLGYRTVKSGDFSAAPPLPPTGPTPPPSRDFLKNTDMIDDSFKTAMIDDYFKDELKRVLGEKGAIVHGESLEDRIRARAKELNDRPDSTTWDNLFKDDDD